jgi:hypothetical protein
VNTGAVPDEDERPRDTSGGADAGWSDSAQPDLAWTQAVAPDDISELSRDIHAYRREQRAAQRRERYGRFTLGPSWAPLTLTVAALAVVAIVATLLTVMGPRSAGPPPALPLPTTTVADGAVGGLLPNVSLIDANQLTVPARGLRPSVLAILPPGCGCGDLVREAASNAGTLNVPLYALVPTGQTADGDSLAGQLQPSAILRDPTGAITSALVPSALTLVLLKPNGTIYRIEKGVDSVDTNSLSGLFKTMLGTTG